MHRKLLPLLAGCFMLGCGPEHAPQPVQTTATAAPAQTSALLQAIRANQGMTGLQLRASHAHARTAELGYEPRDAQGLSALQASTHALSAAELERLHAQGFAISTVNTFPSMLYGYASIYVQDLPLYVSADSILDALFRSYGAMLEQIETHVLIDDLRALVAGMREALPLAAASGETLRDVDLFLAVAQGLLDREPAQALAGAGDEQIAALTQRAQGAVGHDRYELFGAERDIDFSQFQPRGHYTHSPDLESYFQALSWISRSDLRLIETAPTGERTFQPRQLSAALLLRALIDPPLLERYQRIARVAEAFAGRSDAMGLDGLDALRSDLRLGSSADVAALDPERATRLIVDKDYAAQQIGAQLIVNRSADGRPLALSRVFALFGQRYAVDSHVLSNLVNDVVPERLMPNPLDAAFAALGNDAALDWLGPDLDRYAGALESTRQLVDSLDASYWSGSLNTLWLRALRSLSGAHAEAEPLPTVARTRAWDARLLNTQLASWAQLRHATDLYAKPSYSVGVLCEYPDAYVEPYPAFFAALHALSLRGLELAQLLGGRDPSLADRIRRYFDNFANATAMLGDMARAQLRGEPLSGEHMAFINDAVSQSNDCPGGATFDGWYAKLDFEGLDSARVPSHAMPVVADIHTQPTDLSGRDVGRILHVGVGLPRLLVVTVATCHGPRAYAGLASTYRELITENWQRLDDAHWAERVSGLSNQPLAEVDWVQSLLADQTGR